MKEVFRSIAESKITLIALALPFLPLGIYLSLVEDFYDLALDAASRNQQKKIVFSDRRQLMIMRVLIVLILLSGCMLILLLCRIFLGSIPLFIWCLSLMLGLGWSIVGLTPFFSRKQCVYSDETITITKYRSGTERSIYEFSGNIFPGNMQIADIDLHPGLYPSFLIGQKEVTLGVNPDGYKRTFLITCLMNECSISEIKENG